MAAGTKPGTGNLPDPKIDEKLDEAFGTQEEIAAQIAAGSKPAPKHTPGPPMIYAKMIEVARRVSAVGKDSHNKQQDYNFRGIDAVVNHLHPIMAEVGVLPVPTLAQANYRDAMTTGGKPTREVTVQVAYVFYAEDGSSVTATVPGESLDQADKGSAKAMSVAFRIALLQVFSLPTSEPDPDASYNTRDGVGSMSESVRKLLLQSVPATGADVLATVMWPIVLEHSAAERAMGMTTITWADYFAERFAELIREIETWEQGKAMADALRATNGLDQHRVSTGEGGTPATLLFLLDERARYIRTRSEKAFDAFVDRITTATELEELDHEHAAMNEDFDHFVITTKQKIDLLALIGDKRAKLERELSQPDAWPAVTEPGAAEPSGTE